MNLSKLRKHLYKNTECLLKKSAIYWKIVEEASRLKINPNLMSDSDIHYQKFRLAQKNKKRFYILLNTDLKAIIDTKTNEIKSRGLDNSMIDYLMIEKKWNQYPNLKIINDSSLNNIFIDTSGKQFIN